jgi:ArsR family metal-binding transcriptional regulator
MPGAITVQCYAHLEQDVGTALPYLNANLGGFEYIVDPPSVTFKAQGKLITVHGHKIAVNALKDEAEAQKIIEWLKREINEAWENREEIEPVFEGQQKPKLIEILKLLPRTNCKECGLPTCMVFADRLAEGAKSSDDCPLLEGYGKKALNEYMAEFTL